MIVSWTSAEVDAMPVERCRELREQIKTTMIASDNPQQRRDTLNLLRTLDRRIASAPVSVEERTASAREFLHPSRASDATRQKAWRSAVELHGSEREAERRGYRRPEANS